MAGGTGLMLEKAGCPGLAFATWDSAGSHPEEPTSNRRAARPHSFGHYCNLFSPLFMAHFGEAQKDA
jgi:hypothetical protein